ncbi:MAG: hypothetical protein ACK53L_10105, partial [Pirellulaceae bacterium]
LPAIMMTANEGERHRNYAKLLGASDYILKPFAMDQLLGAARRVLNEPRPDLTPEIGEVVWTSYCGPLDLFSAWGHC